MALIFDRVESHEQAGNRQPRIRRVPRRRRELSPTHLARGERPGRLHPADAFDPIQDEPTDSYIEGFAFWGLGYLDARSWRHYLPRLIDYAFSHPDDGAMVSEALLRSLRPPDRYPPRLATLTADQESVVRAFLEQVALGDAIAHLQAEAQQALEEWWLPDARCRPTALEIAALRARPVAVRVVEGDIYRLSVPETFTGSGVRVIPEESRLVQTWGGYLCGDAHTIVAVTSRRWPPDHWRSRCGRAPRCFAAPCRRTWSPSADLRTRNGWMALRMATARSNRRRS